MQPDKLTVVPGRPITWGDSPASSDATYSGTPHVDNDEGYRLPGQYVMGDAPDRNPASAMRSYVTGRDGINTVSQAFFAAYGRAPTPLEAVQFGNYNNLSSAHRVAADRELVAPELDALSRQPMTEEQLRDYMIKAQGFERAKAESAARAAYTGSYRTAEIRHAADSP